MDPRLAQTEPIAALAVELREALLALDRVAVARLLVDTGQVATPLLIYEQVVSRALEQVGQGWARGEVSLSQLYMAGRICEDLILEHLPRLEQHSTRPGQPRLALCVLEDHHQLGKRIVHSVLRAAGFAVVDLGTLQVDEALRQVHEQQLELLLVSTLLVSSARQVERLRLRLDPAVRLLVGGAPFRLDPTLWREVGADAMGMTATEAITLVERFSAPGEGRA